MADTLMDEINAAFRRLALVDELIRRGNTTPDPAGATEDDK